MIKTIPKRKIHICDLCGKEVEDFAYKLDYKQWCTFMHEKPIWYSHDLEICWDCWLNIKRNLQELAKENKNE